MARATYVLRNGQLVNKRTGEVSPSTGEIAMPMVMRDIPEYSSPIDGRMITSRSERREDLKRNNCIEVDPANTLTKGRSDVFKNKRFAKKHGLTLAEQYR
jgi:hypothetical protein